MGSTDETKPRIEQKYEAENYKEIFKLRQDGKPVLQIKYKEMGKQALYAYKFHQRNWYVHHKHQRQPRTFTRKTEETELILADPVIQRYFTVVRNRPRNEGYLSESTKQLAICSCKHFLAYLNLPITSTAMSDLVKIKRGNPADFTIEDKLEQFALLPKITTHKEYGSYILGIFKANRAILQSHIDNHSKASTKPISEGILRQIVSELPPRELELVQLQAYAGQRIKALATVALSQIDMTSFENYAIIHITSEQNKTRQEHDCVVPKKLMESILERCKTIHAIVPFANYEQMWREIRQFVAMKYDIRLTSHYLRKRFATIASETPMDVNQWDYLMGSKKSKGHDANIYNLTFLEKIVQNYDTCLVRKLSPETTPEETSPPSSTKGNETVLEQLKTIIQMQKEQIDKLTDALTRI